jgi:alanyl-tRNA synthetase
LEFWNLVFMQFNRADSGSLQPLPKQSIDTGAGLERVVSLKMGVESVFETDILRSLIAEVEQISDRKYESSLAPAFHVIADHIRSLAFAIADGVQPSNVERGYILRKLLRRAVRYGRNLGLQEPFLARLLPRLLGMMGADYHELVSSKTRIAEVLTTEEESFLRTLKRGGNILNTIIDKAKQSAQKQILGEDAFKLKDTYGFPLEEILLIAKDTGLEVNLESYQVLEEEAKELSRSSRGVEAQQLEESVFKEFVQKHAPCVFVGYTEKKVEACIQALIVNGVFVPGMQEGQEGIVVLDRTPFYAEKGGQVGDTGILTHKDIQFNVVECQCPYPGVITHSGKLVKGELKVGTAIHAEIDSARRQLIGNNHTATHLLHWALQRVLGSHIRQAGSIVDDHRLRFDFSHHKALTKEEVRHVERLVNEKIRENQSVKAYEISYDEAQKHPEIKQFFGEKYGAKVRVIDIDYSKELCGGTHTDHVGRIGLFRIAKEGSISAGVRRIEALTGALAETLAYETEDTVAACCELLKCAPTHLAERTTALMEENKASSSALKGFKRTILKARAQELVQKAEPIAGIPLIAASVDVDASLMQDFIEDLSSLLRSGVILLGIKADGRCQLIAKVSSDLLKKGLSAVQLIKEIAPCIEGSGGGKEGHAQAGGKKPEGITQAFEKAKQWLGRVIN